MSGALPTGRIGFRPEFLDFRRGIRVGRLEEHERITRIVKRALEARYGQPFVTEKWGRGVYWRWIGWLPLANRSAKPVSSHTSFGSAKFFISLDTEERLLACGMQVERGYLRPPPGNSACRLQPDWDWHRLIAELKARGALERELRRLLGEGFRIFAGGWERGSLDCGARDYPGAATLRQVLEAAPKSHWAGFQLYYPMSEDEVRQASGPDLVDSMLAVFDETVPVMNRLMQVRLVARTAVK
ncbi:MAG: hypothetical protein ACP5U2_02760 [Bryobacteraceae bacterium]